MQDKDKNNRKPHYAGHRKRLKERFRNAGRNALHDYELLELLLAYAIPRKDTKYLAKRLLQGFGTFRAVLDAPYGRLEEIDGLGEHASTLMGLFRACMSRYMEPDRDKKPVITCPEDVEGFLRAEIGGCAKERFMLLCLNAAGRLVHAQVIAEGTVDAAHVYPREVLRTAIDHDATALILVHNHPSGTLHASEQDMRLTRQLTDICSHMVISLHDHLIVTQGGAYSIKLNAPITSLKTGKSAV